jgi:Fe-S-cluster containining protein
LPISPQELANSRLRELGQLKDGGTIYEDGIQITEMVEFIEEIKTGPKAGYYYRCKNLLTNGDCGIYEKRPRMCKEYPYGQPCYYKPCNWKAVRGPEHLRKYGLNCKKLPWKND